METVGEFLDKCSQNGIEIEFFNSNTGESFVENIDNMVYGEGYDEIIDATFESWDMEKRFCINYSIDY